MTYPTVSKSLAARLLSMRRIWAGPGHDVWHAHCVKLDDDGISRFARTGTGVAHCPCSNMRLASGIAPIGQMRKAGVPVGLGVDGSASNDGSHMLGEARQAMLLARVGFGPAAMTAREALEIATLGGAKVLNRTDVGALKPGMSADVVAFDLRGIEHAGARCMTPWQHWCFQRQRARLIPWSMASWWCAKGGWSPSMSAGWRRGTMQLATVLVNG